MCTIDPLMCWYYDNLTYWEEHPKELRFAQDNFEMNMSRRVEIQKMIREAQDVGKIPRHEIIVARSQPPHFRVECYAEGVCRSSTPSTMIKDGICKSCGHIVEGL